MKRISVEIPQEVRKEFLVVDLINGYRTRGHLFTKQIQLEKEDNITQV